MLYSNFPHVIHSILARRNNNYSFLLNHQIIFGDKLIMRILCSKLRVLPGMNEDLNIRFTRGGLYPYIEKHIPDWSEEDPIWNRPEQLYFLLHGYKIQTRKEDKNKFRRLVYAKGEFEIFEILELRHNNYGIAILKIEFSSPNDTQYLLVEDSQNVQQFTPSNFHLLEEKLQKTNIYKTNGEWINL